MSGRRVMTSLHFLRVALLAIVGTASPLGCSSGDEPSHGMAVGAGGGGGTVFPDGITFAELAGKALAGAPGFRVVQNFNDDAIVSLAFAPELAAGLEGASCDVFVVAARSSQAWAADATLMDVRGAPQPIVVDSVTPIAIAAPNTLSSVSDGLGVGYDVVLDCNHDGILDAGDVLDGGDAPGFYRTHDTTIPGPPPVYVFDHDGGEPFLQQRIFQPADIAELGVVPLVVVTHGWSYTHTYYDEIGLHLASYGYVVMAHAAAVQNGGPPGTLTAAETTLDNTDHFLANLASIDAGQLAGHVDASRIMLTGHSTGGEAVVRAATLLREGSFSSPHFGYADIRIVSSMAPVSWHPRTLVDPGDLNFHMFVAGADSDVSGAPELSYTQCLSIFERAMGERQLTYIHGAGHGDMLTCCGELFLDQSAPDLIGREETKRVLRGYFVPLAERYLRDNRAAEEYFTRSYADYHPSGIAPHVVVTNDHRAARGTTLVIDDFESAPELGLASSGATVSFDVANVAEVLLQDNDGSFAWDGSQPANGMTRARHAGDEPHGLVLDWTVDEERHYELALPAALRDFSAHATLAMRACQGTRHPETVALSGPLSFTVTLRDEDGATSSLPLASLAPIPAPYQRGGFGPGAGWQNEIVHVAVPLDGFSFPGVDLQRIAALRFDFGAAYGSERGRLCLDDIELR